VGEAGELTRDELLDALIADAERAYAAREAARGDRRRRCDAAAERNVLLNVNASARTPLRDGLLKEGIGLRAMAQRDPLVEYQREGYDMSSMLRG
jgi:preprotein translocase subunit SecA